MILELTRFFHGRDSTLGILTVNGDFHSFTVEDQHQEEKVAGETRIPSGTYTITLRNEGGMTQKYQQSYPDMHRGMLWLRNVPGFEYIYIHKGNTDDHTEGCILVNDSAHYDRVAKEGKGSGSASAYVDLYQRIIDAMDDMESVAIIVRDHIG